MPNAVNRRLSAEVLQADLDCITALKVIEGYAPSNPADTLAAQFKRSPKIAVQAVLDALEELGMVQQAGNSYRLAS